MEDQTADASAPRSVTFEAPDGMPIRGFAWQADPGGGVGGAARPVVIVNPATSVRCRYYFRFASYLFAHGRDVLLYDYRGIGESRPARLAGFEANWLDWGALDFEAALRFAATRFAGQSIDVVAHSIGGCLMGLAPSNAAIRRAVTVGAQYAYWRDYAQAHRLAMLLKWHVAMPALAAVFGYVPARRLGWMEDTPRGVARSWARSRARFEQTYGARPFSLDDRRIDALVRQFSSVRAPLLAISTSDDPFGTVPAIERLLAYFDGCDERIHLRVEPRAIDADAIGHFAFFHSRFESRLWPIVLHWLETATLARGTPGDLVSLRPPRRGPAARTGRAVDASLV
ncbi:alpha/beta hydrolase family protein [Trinickia dinghuensis]|uniref:Alpha/beta fold hydrolase n=1 Tax=Trinickia dinghuensis TaxID=2291023 RepID=A0A3D8JWN5_9BURK|nr:alpha/beta fold hydrolase [Trinickia dinghuensis]RDU97034.1 alpha/beta fold hydrolase [Trinickia dinghuensis]